MKYFIGAISVIVLIIIGIYSGMYNISAMVHQYKLTLWMMNTVRENSIKHNVDDDIKTPNLTDSSLIRMGFVHYREMCVGCHGGPGIEQNEIAKGLYPNPPMLAKVVKDRTPGITHTDDMIWAIVAFTNKLPTLTKEQYQFLENEMKGESDETNDNAKDHK